MEIFSSEKNCASYSSPSVLIVGIQAASVSAAPFGHQNSAADTLPETVIGMVIVVFLKY